MPPWTIFWMLQKQHQLQAIQLHGSESPNFAKSLKKFEIIKAFRSDTTFDFSVLEPYEFVCDYFLLDSKGKLPEATAGPFDWSVLRNYNSAKPFFLSGGIGTEDKALLNQ